MAGDYPQTVPSDGTRRPAGTCYLLGADQLTYQVLSPGSIETRTTDDRDELLYWIVNDLARELAVHWTVRAPSYRGNDTAGQALWLQRWHDLMAALSTTWGERTRTYINTKVAEAQRSVDTTTLAQRPADRTEDPGVHDSDDGTQSNY